LLEGNIANAENFMVLPSIAAAFLVVSLVWKKQRTFLSKNSLLTFIVAGVLLGLSFLIKVVAVFDVAAFSLFFFFLTFENLQKSAVQILVNIATFMAGFCIPILLTALFFFSHGAFKIFLQSTLFSNIGYVNYGNQFIIPQGLLIFKLLLLFVISLALFIKRKHLSPSFIFITLWLSFSVFSALFSQRPYTHYILVLIPSLCLFAAYLLEEKTTISRAIQAVIFIGLVIFLVQTFWIYSKTTAYYLNFAQYVLGQKDTIAYQSFFDRSVPEDYALAQFLQTHMKSADGVFIWGNSGQIYKMANTLPPGRYIVAYHIDANQITRMETLQAVEKQNPKYVIIQPNAPAFPYPLHGYQELYTIDGALIYERVF
ncbi:MAG TPA: hypothetical protein VN711_02175, partial [Candidatus Saccharimonadales bacterium]|nr:hypothetical protein [Candidatus Saccharimonadales bacterium]